MRRIAHWVLALAAMILTGCFFDDSADDSIDTSNYSLEKLVIGIAFPPNSSSEYRDFSIGHMNVLNLDWYRIDQNWGDREPSSGAYNWAPLQSRLTDFRADGKKLLLTLDLKGFPSWVSSLSDDAARVSAFKGFCDAMLAQFPGQIEFIQLGNEWNWEIDSYLDSDDHIEADDPDQLFIDMANALYAAVQEQGEGDRPKVVLGSVSIDALRFMSYAAGSIDNVHFELGDLYSLSDLDSYDENKDAYLARLKYIVGSVAFDYADLHLYDDYWNWKQYLADYRSLIDDTGKSASAYGYIVGEFGGPEPDLEPADAATARQRFIHYVRTLDGMDIGLALFYKLVEDGGEGVTHLNSYLIDSSLNTNSRYDAMMGFGVQNHQLTY